MKALARIARAVAAAALLAALPAVAAPPPGLTFRYPSGDVPDANALNAALQDPSVGTIVFERGTNPFSAPITVFRRNGVTLRGATGRAKDVVLESSATVAVLVEEASGVTFSGLTIRSTAANGEGVRVQAVRSSSVAGFAREVTFRNCRLEGFVPLRGSVRARAVDVAGCTLDVSRTGGAGILWEDGSELFVTRTKFTCSAPGSALGAVLVRGALVAESEGDRARRILLTRNRVAGDFLTGFDLSDVVDARIQRNVIDFPGPTAESGAGRAGIVVRRVSASAQTEDFELRGNVVHDAHTAVWIPSTGRGVVASNDLRRAGSPLADTRFGDFGAALRIAIFGTRCPLVVEGNDLRQLRSAPGEPAARIEPAGLADTCFPDGARNRVDPGRELH